MNRQEFANFRKGSYIIAVDKKDIVDNVVSELINNLKVLSSDISFIFEPKTNIKIAQIRNIKQKLSLKPEGSCCLIYIAFAENMTVEASNAMLKFLEEPPQYAVIILFTKNVDKLLPTIISRCQKITLRSDNEPSIKKEYIDYLDRIKQAKYVFEKFALVEEMVKKKINISEMLMHWLIYLRRDYNNNLFNIKIINKYNGLFKIGVNQKLFLENLLLKFK